MTHKRLTILSLLLCALTLSSFAAKPKKQAEPAVSVANLTAEHLVNPLCLDTPTPRLGWQIRSAERDVMQTAARIIVASSREKADSLVGDLWDHRLTGDRSQWIDYGGKALRSNTRCYWRVKVETTKGESEWSDVNEWNVALLHEADWSGVWIGWDRANPWDVEDVHSRLSARYLREEFQTDGEVRRATLYISGLGLYEAFINGEKVGDDVLTPAPTDYRKTVLFNAYDVTAMLKKENAIGVVLGNGRYYTMQQKKKAYKITNFGYPKLRLNLIIEYADGKRKTVSTNDKWRLNCDGPIRSNNEYDGEIYDARKSPTPPLPLRGGSKNTPAISLNNKGSQRPLPLRRGVVTEGRRGLMAFSLPGFDDSSWQRAERCAIPDGTLRAMTQPAMKELKLLEAKEVKRVGEKYIVDFGQNISGWVHLNIYNTREGDSIFVRYAEKLDSTGNALWRDNLRHAQSTDIYIADGKEQGRVWHPVFSYHGFRYVEVSRVQSAECRVQSAECRVQSASAQPNSALCTLHSALKEWLQPDDIKAALVADNVEDIGEFSSYNETLNKVFHNAKWGVLTNYKGMPVDCPQRDERQPWLGDRTAGCLGESFLFDNHNLYAKWSRDIVEAQREDGCIPDVAPAFWNYYSDIVTWPAALPMTLEMLYEQYGDDKPVRTHYPAVVKWLRHIKYQYGGSGLITKDKYGDWCVPPESQELIHSKDPARQTDGTLISSAYYYRLCLWAERFAKLQGMADDAREFAAEAEAVKKAFNEKFLTVKRNTSLSPDHWLYPDSTFYGNNSATSNILPYYFGIADDEYVRREVAKNIVENIITKNGGHISTGVIGTGWLMRSLMRMGRGDVAWLLATNRSYPSWGYMADKGATTTWELWNGDTANPAMNSGNHVMLLGDLVTWMFQHLGGISSTDGFKHITLKPDYQTDEADNISCRYRSIYGDIESSWHKKGGKLYWRFTIPANTTATVHLPDGTTKEYGSGTYDLVQSAECRVQSAECRVQSAECRVQSAECRVQSFEGVQSAECRVQSASAQPNSALCTLHSALQEWVYPGNDVLPDLFPECHSATITETPKGDLVATFFGGTKERNPDCCIWVSRKPKGAAEWTKPVLAADGVFKPEEFSADPEVVKKEGKNGEISVRDHRKALWNPVVFQNPKTGLLEIYFKMGLNVKDWTGWVVRSKDGGKTWSKRQQLPDSLLGPVKNKIFVSGSRFIAPTSLENGQWRLYFELSDDGGKTWRKTAEVDAGDTPAPAFEAGKRVNAIQPAVLDLGDGRLAAVARTRSERVAYTESADNGETWSKLELLDLPNNNSGLDAVTLQKPFDGGYRHVMICNDHPLPPGIKNGKGLRTPLSLVRSKDGKHWEHWLTLEDSPISQYSYPSIIQTKDGHLHCIYTWRRQRIKHVEISLF